MQVCKGVLQEDTAVAMASMGGGWTQMWVVVVVVYSWASSNVVVVVVHAWYLSPS